MQFTLQKHFIHRDEGCRLLRMLFSGDLYCFQFEAVPAESGMLLINDGPTLNCRRLLLTYAGG